MFGRSVKGMSRTKRSIGAKVPEPNGNVTMSVGNKTLVDAVFEDTGLDAYLDGLKRNQGSPVSKETVALVANSVEMTGLSLSRLDRMLEDERVRAEYGLGGSAPRSVYRTVERPGENMEGIVSFLAETLRRRYGVTMGTVFMDRTSRCFEAPQNDVVRVGYSRDHRGDRPQVTVGLSMDRGTGMPVGLTVNPGNVLDVTHFSDTFGQIAHLLPDGAVIVFDNGAYSKDNAGAIDEAGCAFVTRRQLNRSDDAYVSEHADGWIRLDDDLSYMTLKGNMGRVRYIFRSESRREDVLESYRRRAERDWDQMVEMKRAIEKGARPRKKYRVSNCFVDTRLSYRFPLDFASKEEAVDHAVGRMVCGREGLFVLLTNRPFTAEHTLELYRSRNAVETAFRDLKHGIDWRPARCTSHNAIRGRILISFLALFCMSMVRYLHPEFGSRTAETMVEELTSFSLTLIRRSDGTLKRIYSNFGPMIRALKRRKRPDPVPKAPHQAVLDGYRSLGNAKWERGRTRPERRILADGRQDLAAKCRNQDSIYTKALNIGERRECRWAVISKRWG